MPRLIRYGNDDRSPEVVEIDGGVKTDETYTRYTTRITLPNKKFESHLLHPDDPSSFSYLTRRAPIQRPLASRAGLSRLDFSVDETTHTRDTNHDLLERSHGMLISIW